MGRRIRAGAVEDGFQRPLGASPATSAAGSRLRSPAVSDAPAPSRCARSGGVPARDPSGVCVEGVLDRLVAGLAGMGSTRKYGPRIERSCADRGSAGMIATGGSDYHDQTCGPARELGSARARAAVTALREEGGSPMIALTP